MYASRLMGHIPEHVRDGSAIASRAASAAVMAKCVANCEGNSFHAGPASSARDVSSGASRAAGSKLARNAA